MSDLDPQDQPPAGPQDTQSSDQSKSKLRQAWDDWTSRPENNAALLQFGIAMLQPRAPGQSGIGQFANAIGEGAEASQRNVAAQQQTSKEAFDEGIKSREASARETTAAAYGRQVDQGGGKGKTPGLQSQLATQRAFNTWLSKPSDQTGLTTDPILQAIQKSFPDVKTKGDLLANPQALNAARQLFKSQLAEPGDDEPAPSPPAPAAGASATAPTGAAAAPSPAQGRPVYNKATGAIAGYWYPDRGFVPNGQ